MAEAQPVPGNQFRTPEELAAAEKIRQEVEKKEAQMKRLETVGRFFKTLGNLLNSKAPKPKP